MAENVYDSAACRLRRTSAPFQAWNSGGGGGVSIPDTEMVFFNTFLGRIPSATSGRFIETHCRHPSRRRSEPTWLNRFRISIPPDALKLIAQGHRYDIFENPPLRVVHCYRASTQRNNSLPVHACFDYLAAPTSLSHWPSHPRSWISLTASRSRIIHGSCAEPQTSSSFPRAPVASGLANPCLIPARWCADDARAEPLGVLAQDTRLARSPPSLFAFAGIETRSRLRSSCGRYLTALVHLCIPHANLACLVRLAMVVDGDGEARRWGWDENTDAC
ncbi:hypothetical protein B0H13DRAFT_2375788 [Mycena leptocephala]|nr:hypothetical protein B0H13DRAFT_2375788 [Mycena leptocephala]